MLWPDADGDKALQNHSQSQVNETQNLAKLQETQKATQATQVQAAPKSALAQALTQNQKVTDVKKSEHTGFNNVVREMMEDGLFERFPADEIYALHNWPGLPPWSTCACRPRFFPMKIRARCW